MSRRRVAVVGIDSIAPVLADRFIAEGCMPTLSRIRDAGWSAEALSTMPPTTPTAWTTIATGASPSTHGIEGFSAHREGDPLDAKVHTLSADRCRAEFLWQALARAGLHTTLLKYPVSWPTTGGDLLRQVDGAAGWGGMRCVFDVAVSGCWDSSASAPSHRADDEAAVVLHEWLTRDADNLEDETVRPLVLADCNGIATLLPGESAAWQTALAVAPGPRGVVRIVALARDVSPAVVFTSADDGISTAPRIGCGRWSQWLLIADERGHEAHVRFKILELDVADRRLRLYQTQAHRDAGFAHPLELASAVVGAAGPFVEWTESYDRLQGWIDEETQLEIYEQHVDWMAAAARHLLTDGGWDLFMTQIHFLDMAYHLYWGAVDPAHPAYDHRVAGRYWRVLARAHELADRFLAAVVDAAGKDTLVLILGDHGHDCYHTALLVNHLLLREGFLALTRDRVTGALRIDWTGTSAYANGYRVFVNLRGREPNGAVAPEAYDSIVEKIVRTLGDVVDPRTGSRPVRLALARDDAQSLGLYGGSMGDVVFAMAPGYQSRTTFALRGAPTASAANVPVFKKTRLFAEFTGEHDTSLPFTRAIRTMMLAHGPSVRVHREALPVRLLDVAATVSDYLGIAPPAQNEGNSMLDRIVVDER